MHHAADQFGAVLLRLPRDIGEESQHPDRWRLSRSGEVLADQMVERSVLEGQQQREDVEELLRREEKGKRGTILFTLLNKE